MLMETDIEKLPPIRESWEGLVSGTVLKEWLKRLTKESYQTVTLYHHIGILYQRTTECSSFQLEGNNIWVGELGIAVTRKAHVKMSHHQAVIHLSQKSQPISEGILTITF